MIKKLFFAGAVLIASAVNAAPVIDKITPSQTTYDENDDITFEIALTFDEGETTSVVVTDSLPAGLTFKSSETVFQLASPQSSSRVTESFNGTAFGAVTNGGSSGDDIVFTFNTVELAEDGNANNNTFILKYVVTADGSATGSLNSSASLTYSGGTVNDAGGAIALTVNGNTPPPTGNLALVLQPDSIYTGHTNPSSGTDVWNHFDFDWCDFNGDDWLDAMSWHHNRTENGLLTNDQDGTFTGSDTATVNFQEGRGSLKMNCLDINGDGKDDVFARDQDTGDGIFLTSGAVGTVSFQDRTELPNGAGNEFTVLDWNGDDVFDYGDEGEDPEYRIYNLTTGATITTCFDHTDPPTAANDHIGEGYIAMDWNLDTWPDIVHTPSGVVMLNNGSGTGCSRLDLAYATSNLCTDATKGQGERYQWVGDLDNDGDWDMTCSEIHTNNGNTPTGTSFGGWSSDTDNYQIYEQTSTNTFTNVTPSSIQTIATAVNRQPPSNWVFGDLDNNGYLDLVFPAYSSGGGGVWMNASGSITGTPLEPTALDGSTRSSGCGFDGRIKAALGDYDLDGNLDIVRNWSGCTGAVHGVLDVVRNETSSSNRYLHVFLNCQGNNSDCLQSRINVYTPNTTTRVAPMTPVIKTIDHDYSDPLIGVGTATTVDVEVILPYGRGTFLYEDVATNQRIQVSFVDNVGTWDNDTLTTNYSP